MGASYYAISTRGLAGECALTLPARRVSNFRRVLSAALPRSMLCSISYGRLYHSGNATFGPRMSRGPRQSADTRQAAHVLDINPLCQSTNVYYQNESVIRLFKHKLSVSHPIIYLDRTDICEAAANRWFTHKLAYSLPLSTTRTPWHQLSEQKSSSFL